jgi:hypothetical protein
MDGSTQTAAKSPGTVSDLIWRLSIGGILTPAANPFFTFYPY